MTNLRLKTVASFYQMMNDLKEYPKSSQPNPKTVENLYSFLTTYYDQIIVITVSAKMSGNLSNV